MLIGELNYFCNTHVLEHFKWKLDVIEKSHKKYMFSILFSKKMFKDDWYKLYNWSPNLDDKAYANILITLLIEIETEGGK